MKYLRSANRSAATPDDSHDQIGFRVVESDTEPSGSAAGLQPISTVSQEKYSWSKPSEEPFFLEPIPFVVAPADDTPFYSHNHQPAVTWCDNGDLLAIWFTTVEENGREMEVICSRFHPGATSWEPATAFFKVPDRNMTGSSLCHLPDGTLLHMNGVADSGDWQNLALAMRKSSDNGETWSAPVLVDPRHGVRHQVIAGTIVLADGYTASDDLTAELQRWVKRRTAPYKYPRIITYTDELPRTVNGKIRRAAIRDNDEKENMDGLV